MKHTGWKWIGKVIAACATVFCALSLFCVLFYNPPVHVAQPSGETAYTREGDQSWSRMTEGVAHGRTDASGYNNPIPMEQEHPDILMIGSSQTEGLYIDNDKCVSYLLNQKFQADDSDYYVYNIGMSAHDLYRELDHLDRALTEYEPTNYVFIEVSFLAADPDMVQVAMNHELDPLSEVEPGTPSYYVQKNPYVKLVYQQLSNYKETKAEEAFAEELAAEAEEKAAEAGETEQEELSPLEQARFDVLTPGDIWTWGDTLYLQYIADVCSAHGCQPVIYYIPTMTILEDGTMVPSADADTRWLYGALCAERGILFADTTDAILQAYEEDHIVASGFANTTVGFGHLNADGHRILCDVLYDTIAGEEVAP